MAAPRVFALDSVRTDGWFERVGEGIGSFEALCDIVGARFFAFAMITGARITALTVDRRNADQTLVEFVVGGAEDASDADVQRSTLAEFRRRLVGALVTDEPIPAAPSRATDLEALQQHLGVRYLLLAPLYGYSLVSLTAEDGASQIDVLHDGVPQRLRLEAFRARLRTHVREELDRASRGGRSSIDLGRVAQAEEAAAQGQPGRVVELLGTWPAPLAIFLRTPDGQSLGPDTRALISKGLALLGTAAVELGDVERAEEVFRLAIQYAGEGRAASDVFLRLGSALLGDGRPGEAISPLRRAANLGADGAAVWPMLTRAFAERGRHLAALGAAAEAQSHGVAPELLAPFVARAEAALGEPLRVWRTAVGR